MTGRDPAGRFARGHRGFKPRRHVIASADLSRALHNGGSIAGAARLLGVSRATVLRRIVESKQPRPESRP